MDKKDVDALKLQHRYKMIGIRSMTAPYLEAPSDFNGTFCRFIQETYRFDIDQAKEKFQALDWILIALAIRASLPAVANELGTV